MTGELQHSIFHRVLFPKVDLGETDSADLRLRRSIRYQPDPRIAVKSMQIVIFDFETTGLDSERDRIIEIGAQKFIENKVVDEMSTLIYTDLPLSELVINLTGITKAMLADKPKIHSILPSFLAFIEGSVLVAHNAEFDYGMLKAECSRQGIDLDWPTFCTLKLARELLPELERKTLDSLAQHYELTFESRHRAIGDVKVTAAVLTEMLAGEGNYIKNWKDLNPFTVS
jgi:DNA polymerase III epsilon subunit family exonuclease